MVVKPIENLKGFTASRPPFVIFTICILLFAIVLISLGSYIRQNDIPDYDIDYDWNILMKEFGELEFCLLPNDTQPITTPTTSSPLNITSTPVGTTPVEEFPEELDDSMLNTTLMVSVSLRANSVGHTEVHLGTTHLFSRFRATELGFQGVRDQNIYVTFELHEPLKQLDCSDAGCSDDTLTACLTIIAPERVFPHTRQPGTCNISEPIRHEKVTKMNVKSKHVEDPNVWCNTGTVAKANHKYDPKLTVMLSSVQRSMMNMHLMYTSYFLFVMLITCVCYALVKGPPKHRTISHTVSNEKKISAPI